MKKKKIKDSKRKTGSVGLLSRRRHVSVNGGHYSPSGQIKKKLSIKSERITELENERQSRQSPGSRYDGRSGDDLGQNERKW